MFELASLFTFMIVFLMTAAAMFDPTVNVVKNKNAWLILVFCGFMTFWGALTL